jgi:catechol 2,3-dioxygenase-like lactoylglutathione lyase family enzyme
LPILNHHANPLPTFGLHHVALNVSDLKACLHFDINLMGMKIQWQPDEDNVYLTKGNDNLALHRTTDNIKGPQHLDLMGFFIQSPAEVDKWYAFLQKHQITLKTSPHSHRDGAYRFYCLDPDGNTVQLIYYPPYSK